MKTSKKFVTVFLAVIFICSLISGAVASCFLNIIKSTTNQTVMQITANIKEAYPDVSDTELAQILNGKADPQKASQILSSYGIDSDDWIVYKNENLSLFAAISSFSVCFVCGLALLAIFVLYCRRQKKKTAEITGYLAKLNRGEYNLKIDENTEEEMSLLKNEIYKTTVMLREQSENSQKDREILKRSLQDISHQLKTPLTSIIILIENMLDDPDMPEDIRQDFLEDIRHSTSNISFLVQSLLTLSRFDANSVVLHRKSENVEEIFKECIKNTAVLAEIKEVTVINDCDSPVKILCDIKWLCEALTNVLKNCIEHAGYGGEVRLSAKENNLYTKITVTDNGCGISPNDLPHIFERFYKGRNSGENSVGIGLALAKTVIEKNGGYISVKSELNKGTVFTIKYFKTDLYNQQ